MRVLFATTANDGHWGPLVPFARACVDAGHEVRVAAPASFAGRLEDAGFGHEPFADAPPELIGPVMAGLPSMSFEEADDTVVRDVFGRIDAQAGLPAVSATIERWRPDLVVRESAELACVAAAQRAGVPHVHVCIGMHEIVRRFASLVAEPLAELDTLAGLPAGSCADSLTREPVLSTVPQRLDDAVGEALPGVSRFRDPAPARGTGPLPEAWGDPGLPLVYVTLGSVTASLPPFAGLFGELLAALAEVDARILLTVGRRFDIAGLGPLPANARVEPWWPQADLLAHADAMLGHGGFGTTMGALAAGVPQVVMPVFTSDQLANSLHVAAVGAGIAVPMGPGSVALAADAVVTVLADPAYALSANQVAGDIADLPPASDAVRLLESLVG
ncbi:glycosyltransferase family 1 protein [Nocardioides agariphilus]|uniref:Glycosyltransferase family 1 protein n=1 Tax=Nocardioides agariphilus TaxID=433664 RepID=A0A930VM55_9ACTN|nr:glycosyltransferase [Nocardioides agariphilus]MBF4769202.1 glycosyltransferase family 1 protein [Nocardioides agariphilus]